MCFSSAPKVKPIANAPTASPEPLDSVAVNERDRQRRKLQGQYGRQQTILAGAQPMQAAAPTMPVKTALGS